MKRNRLLIVSLIVATLILVFSGLYVSQLSRQDDWKKRTTPLSQETRDVLCSRFEISPDDPLCKENKDVYVLDFMKVIRNTFRPYETYGIKSSEAATFDDVEEKIGLFKYECEPVTHQADGLSYFVCLYDLRGDREFILTIFFTYPEMAVMRLGSTSRYDD